MMEIEKSKVYVLPDAEGRITRIDGGHTLSNIKDIENWVLIDEGYGDKYNLCQGNYFDKPIMDDRGVCRYRSYPFVDAPSGEIIARYIKDGVEYLILERTQEEMDADWVEPEAKPTQLDRIEAQALYTALMTDTLIEEV